MESGDVSKMTSLLTFRSDLLSRETMSWSKWTFFILTLVSSVWRPVRAGGSLTGKDSSLRSKFNVQQLFILSHCCLSTSVRGKTW